MQYVWQGCGAGVRPDTLATVLRRADDLTALHRSNWEQIVRKPHIFLPMCSLPHLRAGFCLLGFVSALACAARVSLDLAAGRCGAEQASALLEAQAHRHEAGAAAAVDLLELLRLPVLPLLLLDSSSWPFSLANVSEIVAEFTGDPRHGAWRSPRGCGSWTPATSASLLPPLPTQPVGRHGEGPMRARVWSLGLHATLAMEPESVWMEVVSASGSWQVSVESVLAQNYCNVAGLGRCTTEGAMSELLRRHVVKSAPAENGPSKFPHVPDPEGLRREFLVAARNDPGVARADVLLCSEPPFFCALFLGLGKPVIGYIGNPFGAYLKPGGPQEEFYQTFYQELSPDPRNSFACMSEYLSALVYWHTGVSVPTVRPLGLYTRAVHQASVMNVLVTKQIFVFWDMVCVLNQFAEALSVAESSSGSNPMKWRYNSTSWSFVKISELVDKSWANWARHRAAVVLPYDPQQMIFYELYGMGVPLLVPSEGLLPLFTRLGYTNLRDFGHTRPGWAAPRDELACGWTEDAAIWELRWWSSLTDFARMPHLLRWGSVPELLASLLHSDLPGVSARMRRESNALLFHSGDFWRGALARAILS